MIAHCLEALESPSPFERGPAAQKLGRLKAEDAREELEDLAKDDSDEDVRFYAQQSLKQLDMPHVSPEALADLHISLSAEGRTFAANTSSKGIARFKSVPADAMVVLAVSLKPALTRIFTVSRERFRAAGQAIADMLAAAKSPLWSHAHAAGYAAAAAASAESPESEKQTLRKWHVTDEGESFDLHAELVSVGGRLVLEFTDRDGVLADRTVAFLLGPFKGDAALEKVHGWAVGGCDVPVNVREMLPNVELTVSLAEEEN
jgi:hypothetical protein